MRRVLIKVQLWLALGLGLYIVSRWAIPRVVPSTEGERAEGDVLARVLAEAYPEHEIVRFSEGRFPRQPVSVLLARDGEETGQAA